MKVALCFIISYEHILRKEKYWIKWIKSNKDLFNVYFHYKNKNKIKSKWILDHCIPNNYIQTTTYFHVVSAYMSLLNYAYKIDNQNQWFCMLTESCVPIISPKKFRNLFFENYNKTIMRCNRATWNIDFHRRANLKLLDKKLHLSNDPWFTLCRYHVRICMAFISEHNNLYKLINSGGLANESIFAIILSKYEQLSEDVLINSSSTISDWHRMSNSTSPHLFDKCDETDKTIIINELKNNPCALFLRKISHKFPEDKLIELSSWDIKNDDNYENDENDDNYENEINNFDKYNTIILISKKSIEFIFVILLLEIIINFCYFIITKLNEIF
jgi:hypothetical protein